jgi:hypothetical protein
VYVEGVDGTVQCRRVVLDRYLDMRKRERVRYKEGEEKCNVCRGVKEETEEGTKEETEDNGCKEETDVVKREREETR